MSVSLEAVEEAFDIIDIGGRADGAAEMSDDEAQARARRSPRARPRRWYTLQKKGRVAS